MTKTLKTLAVAGITTAVVGAAAPALAGGGGISGVTAQQRYPWNGKVDISYKAIAVETLANKKGFIPTLKVAAIDKATTPWTTNVAAAANLAGDTSLANGEHKIVWDLDAQGLSLKSTNVVFTVSSETNDWLVVDLSGGPTATKYPVESFAAAPEGGWNQDVYKTSKLVLRRISAGSVVTESSKTITIDKPYYAGIFPVTGEQYKNVIGSSPCQSTGGKAPVESVSWNTIMGASGFISNLVTKAGVGFDLPTEEQWEYACRAGTSTKYNWNSDESGANGVNMWYGVKAKDGGATHEVGTATAEVSRGGNAWGLYDMHGNVYEWTLTLFNAQGRRVVRGGCWLIDAGSCSSSARSSNVPDVAINGIGFRLVRTLP